MTLPNVKMSLAALVSASLVTLAANSAIAGGCDWKKMQNASSGPSEARYYDAGMENTAASGAFIKTGNHGMKQSKDIVDTAVSAGDFTTLVTAIKAAGLVDTLKGEGPYTVFAPTDEAFAKIPKEDLQALLKDKEALTRVLTYHVVSGKVTSTDVAKLKTAKTVEGESVTISTGSGVKINNASVIKADIMTSNGVIHVIDTVLMPKS